MSIDHSDFRELVVRPVLERMDRHVSGMNSPAAVELLIGTAAHESLMGRWLRQHPGPARGVYQIEPATFFDLMSWLDARRNIREAVMEWASPVVIPTMQISGNLFFATAVARANYWRKPFKMPDSTDAKVLAGIWKKYWNTYLGAGTEDQFIKHYRELAGGK